MTADSCRVLACLVLFVCILTGTAHAQPPAGSRASSFDLEIINGEGCLSSSDVLSSYSYTFLVFWDSSCPHCVEVLKGCEAFHQKYFGEKISVVGIHGDTTDLLSVRNLLDANDISFFQLLDSGAGVMQAYGVSPTTPALFLVTSDGEIRDYHVDPKGDIVAIMESMMPAESGGIPETERAGTDGVRVPAPIAAGNGWIFNGRQRIRFLGIDSRGSAPTGPYGEEVEPKNNVHYRFEFEISRKINRHIRAGGLLRIGNEGEEVLQAGPQYLGSEWGSAFAELHAGSARLRLGYYTIAMTPLTLMRWDWNDNPRTGGDAGCGCGATAGVLLVESLEELAPELVFEGALASYDHSHMRTRLFYALPRRAKEVKYISGPEGEINRTKYSLEFYGFESMYRRFDSRTASYWQAGIHFTGSWENRRSVDFLKLNYPIPDPWHTSHIATASLQIPLLPHLNATAEWILWNQTTIDSLNKIYHDIYTFEWRASQGRFNGEGGIAGLAFEYSQNFYAKCHYLRLDGNFYSPFAALSYAPAREGVRFSGQIPIPGSASAVSIFYKRLREIGEPAGLEKGQDSFLGLSVDTDLPNGIGGGIGWLDQGAWRDGAVQNYDNTRTALVLTGRYRLEKNTIFQAQYQRVVSDNSIAGYETESLANLFSLYLSSRF